MSGEDRIQDHSNEEESLERASSEGHVESGRQKLRRYDSLDIESAKFSSHRAHGTKQ
ncbi:hypothetical protein CRG98_049636, partial [Punica granatum]